MKIGIFGGTFDPPHLSHLILAQEAIYQLQLQRLLFVLTPDPPHKQDQYISPVADRVAMLTAAIIDNSDFEISQVEINRPGPHYSLDTVKILQEECPNDDMVFLMGGDTLKYIPNWHKPKQFVAACNIIGVMRRPGDIIDVDAIAEKIPGIRETVQFIEAPLLEISSRQIRRRIAEGRPYRYYLPPEVINIIQQRKLYNK